MRVIVLLGLCVLGSLGAPVAEQGEQDSAAAIENNESENELRVKRAEEAIMFGNQQNEAREMKKRDEPSIDMSTIDKGGDVVVKPAIDLETPDLSEVSGPEEDENESEIAENEALLTAEQPEVTSHEEEEEEGEETMIDETPNGTDIETIDEVADEEESDEDGVSDVDYQAYIKALQNDKDYLSQYYKLLGGYQTPGAGNYPYLGYYPYVNPRYRRSQKFKGTNLPPLSRAVKRNHRTKRDLIYPYYDPEYFPVDDGYYNRPYDNYPLENLLDALKWEAYAENEDDDDDDVMNYGYGTYAPFDVVMDEEDEEPWYEPPPKRQAGLTYFPGIKRSRDFYPYFQEPGTHFQAFVPQKRSPTLQEYSDAYEKVMELAAALREQNYYPRDYELEYRK